MLRGTGSQVGKMKAGADLRSLVHFSRVNLNDESSNPNDPFFKFNTSTKQWSYSMRTSLIGVGTFVLKVRLAGRKDYVTGFVLN